MDVIALAVVLAAVPAVALVVRQCAKAVADPAGSREPGVEELLGGLLADVAWRESPAALPAHLNVETAGGVRVLRAPRRVVR